MLMVKAGETVDEMIDHLTPYLEKGDIIIDGGNSHYPDSNRRTRSLNDKGILFIGTGVSGGEEGARKGPSIMPGGNLEAWPHVKEIFQSIAAKVEDGTPCCDWVGKDGAGHFVKMVHNGIEYGIMAAYAEGLGVLRAANVGRHTDTIDAETTPLREPEHYQYDLNLADIAEVWRRGSVIASWLLDLTATALLKDPALAKFAGRVSDSGEGRWTIKAAIDEGVPVPVLTTSLYERFSSRGEADFQDKLLSAMRFEFGGHLEKAAK
jgi:6-phosphogluconate dehydrogenase